MQELAGTPGGIVITTAAILLVMGELFACVFRIGQKKRDSSFLYVLFQLVFGAGGLCILLDGIFDNRQERESWPKLVLAAYALPWLVIVGIELVFGALLAATLVKLRRELHEAEASGLRRDMLQIAEEEARLRTRIAVHDSLGDLLLFCKYYFDHPGEVSRTELLNMMNQANRELLNDAEKNRFEVDEVQKALMTAGEIGVSVALSGHLPEDKAKRQLLGQAIHECAANTLKHADGSRLTVKLSETGGTLRIEIRNNGRAPEGPILESGGLKSLRQMAESAGGIMRIEHSPEFRLLILIPNR